MLLRLSTEEKVLGIGCLTVLVGAFLPWYSVVFNYRDQNISENGFSGDLGVIGFVIFLLVAISLTFLISSHMNFKLPDFGYKKEKINLFLMGESAFLILLTIAIYTKRSLEYTNAELRFGLYISLIGACLGAFAAYAQIQKTEKKVAQDFFGYPESDSGDSGITDDGELKENPSHKSPGDTSEKPKHLSAEKQQKSFFYESDGSDSEENKPSLNAELSGNTEVEENYFPDTSSDEMDDVVDLDINDNAINLSDSQENEDEEEKQLGQGSYFIKEAGVQRQPKIKVDIESIKPVNRAPEDSEKNELKNKVKENESENEKLSFYNDL